MTVTRPRFDKTLAFAMLISVFMGVGNLGVQSAEAQGGSGALSLLKPCISTKY